MSRPVVVIQSGDALENRRRVLPLALAARAHGWEPVLLVDDPGAGGFFFGHGLACVALSAFARLDAPEPDFDVDMADLCALQLRRAAVGGKPFSEEDARATWDATRRIFLMLDRIAPRAIFVWNGFTGVWANALRVYKAARDLPGGFMERGPTENLLFVDPEGVNGFASVASGEFPEGWPDAPAGEAPPGLAAAHGLPRRRWRKRVVFVPLQVNDDSNILLHSERIARMRSLALFALALARELGFAWRVVLRRHPEERDPALNLPRSLRLRIDQKTGLEDWIDRAGVCLTVNSTVGLTAALRGAPVVALGEGTWCRQPFVIGGQDCDVTRVARAVRATRQRPDEIAGAAHEFLGRLAGGALFWMGQEQGLAADKLERCGLARSSDLAPPRFTPEAHVSQPGAAYAAAVATLAAIRGRSAPIAADFDIGPTERLFLTYRFNREPITRERLVAAAEATLGGEVRLASAHRALGAQGDVLICHSKRLAEDAGRYRLVLDEFGFLHARTYVR